MPNTSSPNDKFAFLFSGSTQTRYLLDLKAVFDTITQYYGYKDENIWVVSGDSALTTTDFPGANLHRENISDQAGLESKWGDFLNDAKANNVKVALLYFTGLGDLNGLTITPTGPTLNSDWFKDRLNHPMVGLPPPLPDLRNCHVNMLMQQSHGAQFLTGVQNSGLEHYSFIAACGSGETMDYNTDGDETDGGFFTYAWTKALQFEKLPAGGANAGKYADQLDTGNDINLISMAEARDFAVEYCANTSLPGIAEIPHQ